MSTPLNNSLVKAFEILALFSVNTREISTALISERLGMNSATAHRFLTTLEHTGAIRSTRRGHYALGPKIDELAMLVEETNPLALVVGPVVEQLSLMLGESTMACSFTRHGPACVAVSNASRTITVNIGVGTLLPALTTAQGKLWLSQLPPAQCKARIDSLRVAEAAPKDLSVTKLQRELATIREQGYAINLGDNEPDIAAVSVPVPGKSGATNITLSTFGMLRRFDSAFIETAKDALLDAASQLRSAV